MVENQHKLIKTYRDLSQTEIDMINSVNEKQKELKDLLSDMAKDAIEVDGRHLSIARTHLETGFMFLVKAIAKPEE